MEMKKKPSVKNANGVKEYHSREEVNDKNRKTMEDSHFVQDAILLNIQNKQKKCSKSILFGVFDGHGTQKISKHLAQCFPAQFLKQYLNKKNPFEAFKNTFLDIDSKLKNLIKQSQTGGSTGTVGLILIEESKRVLYVAHVGDSSAFLFDDKEGEILTPAHRPDNLEEKKRISQLNEGAIIMNRVGGVLAVTRAFGDFHLKSIGLTAVPAVRRIQLGLKHKYLVVATDGLWDYVKPDEVLQIIKQQVQVEDISKVLIKRAIDNNSTDNITVIVLKL